jgi:hypothetical protein
MPHDRVVEEVRAAREAYAGRFGFDLRAICRDLREREQASDHQLVSLPPRPPEAVFVATKVARATTN